MTGFNPNTTSIVDKLTVPTTCGDRIRLRCLKKNQRNPSRKIDRMYSKYKRLDHYGFINYQESDPVRESHDKLIKDITVTELGEKYLIFFRSIFVNNILPTYIAFFVMIIALASLILQILGIF